MGITTNNRILNSDAAINTSNNNRKTKTEEKARDAFQDIMGMMSNAQNNGGRLEGTGNNPAASEAVRSMSKPEKVNNVGYSADKDMYIDRDKAYDDKAASDKDNVSEKSNVSDKDNTSDRNKLSDSDKKSDRVSDKDKISDKERIPEDNADAADASSETEEALAMNEIAVADETKDAELVAEVMDQIVQLISDKLGIPVEDIEAAMQELDMNMSDLLDETGVKNLVLKLQSATDVDLLIDEGLNQSINDILGDIQTLLENNNIEDTGALKELVLQQEEALKASTMTDENRQPEVNNTNIEESAGNISEDADVSEMNTAKNISNTEINNTEINNTEMNQQSADSQSSNGRGNQQMTSSDGNIINNIAQALTNAVNNAGQISEFEGDVKAADIVRQVVEQIKTNISDKVRSLEIRLNPENLGRVQINVTTKNGVMQAQIITETEAARNAIENSIALLKETFNENDLKVEAVEVMVADYEFFKDNQDAGNEQNGQKNSSRRGNSDDLNDDIIDEGLSEAEQLEKEIMQQSGNSVSYSV